MADDFSERYGALLTGSYDCVDRIVLKAYFGLGHNPGGFRCWWRRLHGGSDDQLDNTHLMRFAGRFARRVKAWAAANGVPLIYCKAGQRKHLIAEEYLKTHPVAVGLFLILAAKAPATTEARDTERCLGASLRRAVNEEGRRSSDDEHGYRRHEQDAMPSKARREMGHTYSDVGHEALVPGVSPTYTFGGQQTQVIQNGTTSLVFVNQFGQTSNGHWINPTQVFATDFALTGTVANGKITCNCPGWAFALARAPKRSCKHTLKVRAARRSK